MIAVDAHIKLLQHQMGHASVTIALNLYGHLYPEATRPVMDALGQAHDDAKTPSFQRTLSKPECKDEGDPR